MAKKNTNTAGSAGEYFAAFEPKQRTASGIRPFEGALIARDEYSKALDREKESQYRVPPDIMKEPVLRGFEELSGKKFATPEERDIFWDNLVKDPASVRFLNENMDKFLPENFATVQAARINKEKAEEVARIKAGAAQDKLISGQRVGTSGELELLKKWGINLSGDQKMPNSYWGNVLNKTVMEGLSTNTLKEKYLSSWHKLLKDNPFLSSVMGYMETPTGYVGGGEVPATMRGDESTRLLMGMFNNLAAQSFSQSGVKPPKVERIKVGDDEYYFRMVENPSAGGSKTKEKKEEESSSEYGTKYGY